MDNPKNKNESPDDDSWNKSSKRAFNKKKSPYKEKSEQHPKKAKEPTKKGSDAPLEGERKAKDMEAPELLEPNADSNNQDIMDIFKSDSTLKPKTVEADPIKPEKEANPEKVVTAPLPNAAEVNTTVCFEKEQLLAMFSKIDEIDSLLRIKKEEIKEIFNTLSLMPENTKEFLLPLDVAIIEYKKSTTRMQGGNRGGRQYNSRPKEPESIPEWSLEKNSDKGENCEKLFTLESMDADNKKIEEEKRNFKKKIKEKEELPAKIEALTAQLDTNFEFKQTSTEQHSQPFQKTPLLEELFTQKPNEHSVKHITAKGISEIEQKLIDEKESDIQWASTTNEDVQHFSQSHTDDWGLTLNQSKDALLNKNKEQVYIPKPVKPETISESKNTMQPPKIGSPPFAGNPFVIPTRSIRESDRAWFYIDPQGKTQGPFTGMEMGKWFMSGYFKKDLPIAFYQPKNFFPLGNLLDGSTKSIDEQLKFHNYYDKMNYPVPQQIPKPEYMPKPLKTLEEMEAGKYMMPSQYNYMMKPFNNQPISNIFSKQQPQPQYPGYMPPPYQQMRQYGPMGPMGNPDMLYHERMMGMMGNKEMGGK